MDRLALTSTRHGKIGEVLEAVKEVITSQQTPGLEHEPTPTEYFVVILKTLSSGTASEHMEHLLKILEGVLPQTSPAILRDQFVSFAKITLAIGQQNVENTSILKHSLGVLGDIMVFQETSEGFWGSVHALQTVNAFLGLIDDHRSKIRKTVENQLVQLLQTHKKSRSRHASTYIAEFCLQVLQSCSRSEYKRSLFVVVFLEKALCLMPDEAVSHLFGTALRLQSCGQSLLTAAVLRMVDAFFQNPNLTLHPDRISECVNMLIRSPPETADMEANTYYCTAIASGVISLRKSGSPDGEAATLLAVQSLVRGCEAEFTQVHCAVATALKRIISTCTDDANLPHMISTIEGLLQLRFQHAWLYTMDAVRGLFDSIRGDRAAVLLSGIALKVAEMYQGMELGAVQVAPEISITLADTLGSILRCLGVVNFLTLIPLHLPDQPAYIGIDTSREWLLSILHTNLKLTPCRLTDFCEFIVPMARQCNVAVANPEKHSLNGVKTRFVRTRVLQFWSLFPDFCHHGPVDIHSAMPKVSALLEAVLGDAAYPDLLGPIVVGLTNLAQRMLEAHPEGSVERSAGREPRDLGAMRAAASTFLPILLTRLEAMDLSDDAFQSVVHCLAALVAVAPSALVNTIAKKLLQLLLTNTTAVGAAAMAGSGGSDSTASGWMSVMQTVIPHLSEQMVAMYYRTVRPLLAVGESIAVQKRAYQVLEALLRTQGDVLHATEARSAILGVVSDSLLNCHVSARNMRLRCLATLLDSMTDEEVHAAADALLGEVLICIKDANKKTRDGAANLLRVMIRQCPAQAMFHRLCAAVVAETAPMRSAGIIGICILLLGKRTEEDAHALLAQAGELLPTVTILLREGCVEQTRAVLSLIRVCAAVLPLEVLGPMLPGVVGAFTEGLGAHKAKFASRARAILRKLLQRVGEEVLRPLVPPGDLALLDYILRQARKADRRKEARDRQRDEMERMLGSDSESDDDDDDHDGGGGYAGGMDVSGGLKSLAASDGAPSAGKFGDDPRFASRPKATRAKDVMSTSVLPSSLDDLLEDQPSSLFGARSAGGPGAGAGGGGKAGHVKRPGGGRDPHDGVKGPGDLSLVDGDEDDAYQVLVTTDGRVVVKHREREAESVRSVGDGLASGGGGRGGKMRGRGRDGSGGVDEDEEGGGRAGARAGAVGEGSKANKRARMREPGEEYRSKKAGGDVWKKGMLEPHAYIPLDGRLLSKSNHREAVAKFNTVVSSGRSKGGSAVGGRDGKRGGSKAVGNRKQRDSKRMHQAEKKI